MKFGKVLTYKDIAEAKRLIGKRVVASDILYGAESDEDWGVLRDEKIYLSKVIEGNPFPFRVSNGTVYQFIREVLPDKLEYEPYDLSDPKVRERLRGRWFRDEYGNEVPVDHFDYHGRRTVNVWYVNGYSPRTFLEKCVWLDDGTPCGRRMDKEMSSPVLTRDGKEDEK